MKIPLTKPLFNLAEINAVKKVLASGWVTQGPITAKFERNLEKYINAKHVVVVSNCTNALHLCLLIGSVKPGDEVIVPSLTYIATISAIRYVGAVPVFADIDLKTFTLDPQATSNKITKKTKFILLVHQIGISADLDPLRSIARKNNLILIEDAAPALGATYKEKMVGQNGKFVAFSFHPRKSITTGEGGAIATEDDETYSRLKILRSHGSSISDYYRHKGKALNFEKFEVLGFNYRLSDINAAIGIEQLKKLPGWIILRRRLAKNYQKEFKRMSNLIPPFEPNYTRHTFQSYQIRVRGISSERRDELIQRLLRKNIATRRGVMASHLEPLYIKYPSQDLINTEIAYRESLLLPMYPDMTQLEQEYVVDSVKKVFAQMHL